MATSAVRPEVGDILLVIRKCWTLLSPTNHPNLSRDELWVSALGSGEGVLVSVDHRELAAHPAVHQASPGEARNPPSPSVDFPPPLAYRHPGMRD